MSADRQLARLRRLLLALVALSCLAVLAELLLQAHFEQPLQWVPLLLLGLGAVVALAVWRRPSPGRWRAFRLLLALFALAAAAGVLLHFWGNLELQRELRPGAPLPAILPKLLGGASPLLAPGILALLAALGFAAGWGEPAAEGPAEDRPAGGQGG